MNLKKLNILVILFIGLLNINSIFYASEGKSEVEDRFTPKSTLEASVEKAVKDTNFNGSVMITQNNGGSYDVLYEGAAGSKGGYSIDTVYDVGSVSKLYTTTAIMLLQEEGKLEYSDTLSMFFDNVPKDKANITIKMLLTHTSGIYASENDNHNVTKEKEVQRIFNQDLRFKPGTNYVYSNAGFTLLAAIIEEVSGQTYEDFLTENIFDPLGFESTGFPNSSYLKDVPAVSGTLDGVNYGKVTNFDFGWYSKGYSDVLTTPRELTYFFQALISGKLLSQDNLKLMNLDEVNLGSDMFRGYGTDVKHYGTKKQVVGHTGIWYGGNTAAYYRPADKILFIFTCDQLNVSNDLPANYVFNTINAMYPAGKFKGMEALETVTIEEPATLDDQTIPVFNAQTTNPNNNELVEPLTKSATTAGVKAQTKALVTFSKQHLDAILILLCIIIILTILIVLFIRIRRRFITA